MPRVTSGEFYARAVFELALGKSELERWRVDLREIANIAGDEELMALLEDSELSLDAKKGLLEKRLGEINPLALNLACLLVSRDKLKIAGDISQEYERLLDAHYGIEHAEFFTALPLDEKDKEKFSSQLEKITGRKFSIDARVDPTILGGLIIKVGDMLIDRSLRGRLEALRKDLTEASR
jgi:F-type H+-transporting ATPase subunit delta